MAKFFKALMLFIAMTAQAQNQTTQQVSVSSEITNIEVISNKKCTCSVCKQLVSCNPLELASSECLARTSKKGKGTHILATACAPTVYPNPVSINTIDSTGGVMYLIIDNTNCPDVYMQGYNILDQNGSMVQAENFTPTQEYAVNVSNVTPGMYILNIILDEVINDTNIATYQIIVQ